MNDPHTSAFNVEFCLHGTLISMSGPSQNAQLVTCIMRHYCHRVHLLSFPIPSPSSCKYVQQWDHTWACPSEREGKDSCWDSGWKSHHIVPPIRIATSLTLTSHVQHPQIPLASSLIPRPSHAAIIIYAVQKLFVMQASTQKGLGMRLMLQWYVIPCI